MTLRANVGPSLSEPTSTAAGRAMRAFTLVEMLVVIAVLGILIALLFKGGSALTSGAKKRHSEALIQSLDQAVTAYKDEVRQSRIPNAEALFGGAPPDDLYVFDEGGARISGCDIVMAAGRPVLPPGLRDTRDASGRLASPQDRHVGDIRAMVLAMRLRSADATAILDQIDDSFTVGAAREQPPLYFDPGDGSTPIPLDYYKDAWGTPIEYYATRRCDEAATLVPREAASDAFVNANNGEPLLVSYGPDGPDQFSMDFFSDPSVGDTTLIADFYEEFAGGQRGRVNNVLNQDNIYSSDTFKTRMME